MSFTSNMSFTSKCVRLAITAVMLPWTACKFTPDSSTKSLNSGLLVGERTQDPSKAQVLIHYANNPVNTNTYLSERSNILKSFDDAGVLLPLRQQIIQSARGKYADDLDAFNNALAVNIADIKLALCRSGAALPAGAIFINNSAIVNRDIQYCLPNGESADVPAEKAKKLYEVYDRIKGNTIFQFSPLSHLDILRASMDLVTELFPSDKYEYSLVIKSHGNEELAITPKVAFESRIISGKFIARYFQSRPESRAVALLDKGGLDKGGLDKGGLDKQGLDKGGLDKAGLDKGGLDKGGLDKGGLEKGGLDTPSYIEEQDVRAAGISKEQLLRTIMDPARNMFFNVLFLESCKSDLGVLLQDLADTPTPNIGYLFTSDDKGLSYNTISYYGARTDASGSLRIWLVDELNRAAAKAK